MQNVMSALPPIADMCSALGDVRFVPIADIGPAGRATRRFIANDLPEPGPANTRIRRGLMKQSYGRESRPECCRPMA